MTGREAVAYSFKAFEPFSERFRVDYKRFVFDVTVLSGVLGDTQGKTLLDVGCNIGLLVCAFKKLGVRAVGIDKYIFDEHDPFFHVANNAPLRAIWAREGVDVIKGDFFDVAALQGKQFDIVISDATIEHVRDPRAFLERMHAVTATDGHILISTPNLTTMLRRIRFVFGRSPLWDLKSFYDTGERFTGHWREYTLRELCQMCEWAGFEVVNAWNKNMLAPFKFTMKKMPRFIARVLSFFVPGSCDMNFIVCRKK